MEKIKIILETLYIFFKIILTKKTIILGPYHGEFGFEVSMNASFANSLKRKFNNKLIVVSREGNHALYQCCNEFIAFNYDLKNAGYGYGKIEDSLQIRKQFKLEFVNLSNSIFIDLTRINIFVFKKLIKFSFVNLSNQNHNPTSKYISVHFRSILKSGNDKRSNFTEINANKLVNALSSLGFEVNVIGHPELSYCPSENCIDCRSNEIGTAINCIQNSIITIGQLSGPIHLAHLSSKPVLTWAEGKDRFKTIEMWNPFNQKCIIVSYETFNPNIDDIIFNLINYTKSL
jgi:hypothetical protein